MPILLKTNIKVSVVPLIISLLVTNLCFARSGLETEHVTAGIHTATYDNLFSGTQRNDIIVRGTVKDPEGKEFLSGVSVVVKGPRKARKLTHAETFN